MMRAEGLSLSKSYDPVNIDPARVVKTLTGLRPYRPTGYVVRREEFAGKALVHNYGHGGCGVTLSWGCAEQAVKLLSDRQAGSVAVIGAGHWSDHRAGPAAEWVERQGLCRPIFPGHHI